MLFKQKSLPPDISRTSVRYLSRTPCMTFSTGPDVSLLLPNQFYQSNLIAEAGPSGCIKTVKSHPGNLLDHLFETGFVQPDRNS